MTVFDRFMELTKEFTSTGRDGCFGFRFDKGDK